MREDSAVVAISANQILVFGGLSSNKRSDEFNSGYIFNITTQSVNRILGKERDFAFMSVTN